MIRSRAAKFGTIVVTTLALAFVAVVSSSSHETDDEEDAPSKQGPGPKAGQPVPMPPGLIGLQIAVGLKDEAPADWQGEVKVSEGTVAGLEVVRSGAGASVEGSRFRLESAKGKGANKKKQQAKKKQGAAVGAVVLANLDAPADATVTVATGKGRVPLQALGPDRGPAADVPRRPGRRPTPAGGRPPDRDADRGRLPRLGQGPPTARSGWSAPSTAPSSPTLTEVDPKDFDRLLVPRKNGDRIVLRRFDGKAWQPPIAVTDAGRDLYRPTVAVDGQGAVLVAWAENVDGDWEIFRRTYTPPKAGGEGTWSDPVRVTRLPGSDFHVVAATDSRGVVWLAWQGWRDGNYEIMASAQKEGHAWSEPRAVSDSKANDWSPAIAADGEGNVYVAWDTYDKRNYDVRLRNLAKPDAKPIVVADSARFEGRPHLACDKDGRLWIAYEEGDEQWGKDYAHAGNVHERRALAEPGLRALRQPDGAGEVPRRRQADAAVRLARRGVPRASTNGTRACPGWPSTTTGASGCSSATTPRTAARSGSAPPPGTTARRGRRPASCRSRPT